MRSSSSRREARHSAKCGYISFLGETPEAVVSSLWHLMDELGLDVVEAVLICSPKTVALFPRVLQAVKALNPSMKVYCREISDEGDFADCREAVEKAAETLRSSGLKVVIDATAGTKVMSISAFQAADEGDAVIYYQLKDSSIRGLLYPCIPSFLREVRVLKGELEG